MTTTSPTSKEDEQDDITRYAIGDMTLDEQIAFEVRMAENEELARRVAVATAIDDLLHQAAVHDRRRGA